MTCHNSIIHNLVGNAVCACFNHSDTAVGGGNCCCHIGNLSLGGCGVDNELAVNIAHRASADRAVPGNIGNGKCNRSTYHSGNLRLTVGVNGHNGTYNGNVVSHILGEKRSDRSVDNAACKDSLLGGSALSFEEAAGNFSYRVELLLKIYREREKVDALTGLSGTCYCNVNNCLAVANKAGAVCKLSGLTCFDDKGSACEFRFESSELVEGHK